MVGVRVGEEFRIGLRRSVVDLRLELARNIDAYDDGRVFRALQRSSDPRNISTRDLV